MTSTINREDTRITIGEVTFRVAKKCGRCVVTTNDQHTAERGKEPLRTLARFDRMWGRFFRGHPFVKNDIDVTEADFAKYHVVLFGDPGSNRWIAKLNGKLPFTWTAKAVALGGKTYPSSEHYPALIYPNPLHPTKYVVLNTGLTIEDRGYNGDYGTPLWGDYAIVKVKPDAAVPDLVTAGSRSPRATNAVRKRRL